VLRGAESELLTAETAAAMTRSGPGATLVTVDGAGHAPALLDADQVRTITDWLDATVPS
jgi:pimeloyl-ACP methyl ester carboxylesterase